MQVEQVLAVVATADLERAEAFYTELFAGGPTERPMEGLLEWHLGTGVLQVTVDARRAGGSMATLLVDAVPDVEGETSDGQPFRALEDPDGNAVTLVAAG